MTRSLAEALDQARRNEEWRSEYMKELLHEDDVRTDAFAEGRMESRQEIARNMYNNSFSLEQIALVLNEDQDVIIDWLKK